MPKLDGSSPFGLTLDGRQDFRGVFYVSPMGEYLYRFEDLSIQDTDFSGGNFQYLGVERCTFRNCLFDCAIMSGWRVHLSKFENCSFKKADMRQSSIGFGGTEFSSCSFDAARLARIGFTYVVFNDIDFDGRDWSHVLFETSGFWNCRFIGHFKDSRFLANYLYEDQRVEYGNPDHTGFHNVDLSQAEIEMWGFLKGWVFDDVRLPKSGTAFLCKVRLLLEFGTKFTEDNEFGRILWRYLKIFATDSISNATILVSKHDLTSFGDVDTGAQIYELMKTQLAR
ncbi:MAG TPA: hypothetical protein VM144_05465 [Aestuariivirga sp.]|nr:hypothetical protein [Aestuariivirga sp.]